VLLTHAILLLDIIVQIQVMVDSEVNVWDIQRVLGTDHILVIEVHGRHTEKQMRFQDLSVMCRM